MLINAQGMASLVWIKFDPFQMLREHKLTLILMLYDDGHLIFICYAPRKINKENLSVVRLHCLLMNGSLSLLLLGFIPTHPNLHQELKTG